MYQFDRRIAMTNKPVVFLPIKLPINSKFKSINKSIIFIDIRSSCSNFYLAEEFFIYETHKYGITKAHIMKPGNYSCYLSTDFNVIREL